MTEPAVLTAEGLADALCTLVVEGAILRVSFDAAQSTGWLLVDWLRYKPPEGKEPGELEYQGPGPEERRHLFRIVSATQDEDTGDLLFDDPDWQSIEVSSVDYSGSPVEHRKLLKDWSASGRVPGSTYPEGAWFFAG